jgi:hypothetical protein
MTMINESPILGAVVIGSLITNSQPVYAAPRLQ